MCGNCRVFTALYCHGMLKNKTCVFKLGKRRETGSYFIGTRDEEDCQSRVLRRIVNYLFGDTREKSETMEAGKIGIEGIEI